MSAEANQPSRVASCGPRAPCHSYLVQLPDELLCMIFDMLAFKWMLQMSHACRRLLSIARSQSTLWQELPAVPAGRLRALEPFTHHSRSLGFDLTTYDITLGDLSALCQFLGAHLDKLRALRLRFADLPEGTMLEETMLLPLHQALATRAPLLEVLALDGKSYEPFLGVLRPDILGGAAAPNLWKLSLTAFALPTNVCPGFQCVDTVVTTVGALSPKHLAADNLPIHDVFPAIQHVEISGIKAERATNADDDMLHRLVRVPALNAPIASLTLAWHKDVGAGATSDARAADWLVMSLPHVQQVHVTSLQCPSVSRTVLASGIGDATVLRLLPYRLRLLPYRETVELALWSGSPQRLRAAILKPGQARKRIETVLRDAQYLRLDTLTISTEETCIELLRLNSAAGAWDALTGLRTLSLVIDWSSVDADGWFINLETLDQLQPLNRIQTLHVQAPAEMQSTPEPRRPISALCLVVFMEHLIPKAKTAVLRLPEVQVYDPELLAVYPSCEFSYISPH